MNQLSRFLRAERLCSERCQWQIHDDLYAAGRKRERARSEAMLAGGTFGAGSAELVAVPDDSFHSSQGPSIRSFPSPVSMRLDADKLVFSPKLNPLQANALQTTQTARRDPPAAALPGHPQSGSEHRQKTPGARDPERKPLGFSPDARPQAKSGAGRGEDCDDNRTPSVRDLQKKLFQLKRQYRAEQQTLLASVRLHGLFESQRPHAAPGTGAVGRRMKWEW